jgi:Tol biopolymer transport system component/tRNA A-37 threonylcarbamoyl transferase component Bud32
VTRVLATGTPLGRYEILGPLGSGAMGEVYRARDRELGRDVAIKVLPPVFARDPERLDRFEQEARAVGQLHHANVLAVYDVGREGATPFVVTELLEGASLRDELAKGPLPFKRVAQIAAQIAHGLAATHARGLIHRDLKPENVFVTRGGTVKILDFGLAKRAPDGEAPPRPQAPGVTQSGVILGTAEYMSPEQIRGEAADARSDLFALGAVLYEMTCGRRPFAGTNSVEVMYSVLNDDPPAPATVRPEVPAGLEHIIARALEKDPARRFQSAADLGFALEFALGPATAAVRAERRPARAWAAALAVAAPAAIALGWLAVPRAPARPMALSIAPPLHEVFGGDASDFAVSPDGRTLVFSATDGGIGSRLWVRPLDSLVTHRVPGTEGATCPFWSPDGREVAFFADGKLKRTELSGAAPRVVCDAPQGRGGAWSPRGVILFAPSGDGPLVEVDADGGRPTPATRLGPSEVAHRFPRFLPDGKRFVYVSLPEQPGGFPTWLATLGREEGREVLRSEGSIDVAPPDWFLFRRGGVLVAQRFTGADAHLVGEPRPLQPTQPGAEFLGGPVVTASASVVACRPNDWVTHKLAWIDRKGGDPVDVSIGRAFRGQMARLSPDGRRVALAGSTAPDGSNDIWTLELATGKLGRVTSDPASELNPVWSPDGRSIAYRSNRDGRFAIYERASDGLGDEHRLVSAPSFVVWPCDWKPQQLVYVGDMRETARDLWSLSLTANAEPVALVRTRFDEREGRVSPDGRWMVYQSDESGRSEVYLLRLGTAGSRQQVSSEGGWSPIWRGDGRELFFLAPERAVQAVSFGPGDSPELGTPHVVRRLPVGARDWDVSADGSRFLVLYPDESRADPTITVVANWTGLLGR